MQKVSARLIVNFTDRDHHRSERSVNVGLKALRQTGESEAISASMREYPDARQSAHQAEKRWGVRAGRSG
jgi:hypothetical protein